MDGFDELISRLENMKDNIIDGAVKTVDKTADDFTQEAKLLAELSRDKGELIEEIQPSKNSEVLENVVTKKVTSHSDHGAYIEFGTGQRGEDSPSPPKYDGEEIRYTFQKEHMKKGQGTGEYYDYMGMAAKPYMYPALQTVEGKFAENAKEAFSDALKED